MSLHGSPILWAGGSDGVSPEVVKSEANAPRVTLYDAAGAVIGSSTAPLYTRRAPSTEFGTSASPTMGDIVKSGGSALSSDFYDVVNTGNKIFYIPVMAGGFEHVWINAYVDNFNVDVNLSVYSAGVSTTYNLYGGSLLAPNITISSGTSVRLSIGAGAVGLGGTTDQDPAVTNCHYPIGALEHIAAVALLFKAVTTPGSGTWSLDVTRI